MAFLLLALSLNACKTVSNDDQPSQPLDIIGSPADVPEALFDAPPKAAEPAKSASPAEPPVTRRDCNFVDPNRTQDKDGHVVVKCGNEIFSATATYKEDGAFEFLITSASAAVAIAPEASSSPPDAVEDAK